MEVVFAAHWPGCRKGCIGLATAASGLAMPVTALVAPESKLPAALLTLPTTSPAPSINCSRSPGPFGAESRAAPMTADAAAAAFYTKLGFEVGDQEDGLDLWPIFGYPGGIHADQGERLFARWL